MNELPPKPQIRIFFATMDKNHDGVITKEEVTQMIKDNMKKGGGRGLGLRQAVRGEHSAEPSKPVEKKRSARQGSSFG